jgi:DedD protein
MAESEEALQLKRRARRRLVGAIALVTFVVVILPLILDKEPGPAGPPLDVQIPKQESGAFTSRAVPSAPQLPAVPAAEKKTEVPAVKAEPLAAKAESSTVKLQPPPVKAELSPIKSEPLVAKAEPSQIKLQPPPARVQPQVAPPVAREAAKAPAPLVDKAVSGDQTWVVTLDAFSNARNVKQLRTKLSAAGVKSYTEPVKTSKGELTRVRAGPFASREAAEKVRAKLDAMGLKPGAVASR